MSAPWRGTGGEVTLYRGSPTGLDPLPAGTWTGANLGDDLGRNLTAVGDTNGDGLADAAVGCPGLDLPGFPNGGGVFLLTGEPGGLSATPTVVVTGDAQEGISLSISAVGDLDGDGLAELGVGRVGGELQIWAGDPVGPAVAPRWTLRHPTSPSLGFGSAAAGGDVDGDGFRDLLVGSPLHTVGGRTANGGAWLYYGGPAGPTSSSAVWWGPGDWDNAGSVLAVGDLDEDGLDDIVLSALEPGEPLMGLFQGAGRVWVLAGAPDADHDAVADAVDACAGSDDTLDADADGTPNGCDTPGLTLSGVPAPGSAVSLEVTAGDGERVWVAAGAGGAGPCPGVFGGACLSLGPSFTWLGARVTARDGHAVLPVTVPATLPSGSTWFVQAAVRRGVGGAGSAVSAPLVIAIP